MSTSRLGRKWADVDEEDEEVDDLQAPGSRRFETPADENGIKKVMEYTERNGKTYKITKTVKQTTVQRWTNQEMVARRSMAKFGKAATSDPATEASHCIRSEEDINIEVCKKQLAQVQTANDAEDKFLEEAIKNCESLFKQKKVWTDVNRDKQTERDATEKKEEAAAPAADAAAAAAPAAAGTKYLPPSLRTGAGKGGGKGDISGQQEASLRITNLSEDAREGDLQELFGQFGRLQRVFLAKDMNTHMSKGFAFVTYYAREDAQKAIDKLHGHGYDNLILQVQWAKPRA